MEAENDNIKEAIPPFPESYHKARSKFNFFAGLLLIWEWMGVNVNTIDPLGFEIVFLTESPQAFTIAILLLTLFFGGRYWIEWGQSDFERRKQQMSSYDFRMNMSLGALAIAVYVVQRLLEVQLADLISSALVSLGLLAILFALLVQVVVERRFRGAINEALKGISPYTTGTDFHLPVYWSIPDIAENQLSKLILLFVLRRTKVSN